MLRTIGSTALPRLTAPPAGSTSDRICTANRSKHRLTKPRTPQTNGMIERFNDRIAEVLASTCFDSAEHFADTIKRYVKVYNQHSPQTALGHSPPLQAMKNWSHKQPQLFKKCAYNLAGLDTYRIIDAVRASSASSQCYPVRSTALTASYAAPGSRAAAGRPGAVGAGRSVRSRCGCVRHSLPGADG